MGGGGGPTTTTTVHTYYYYRIMLAHNSIDPSKEILLYNAYGEVVQTIPPYSGWVDYGLGIIAVPGDSQNNIVAGISTATYYVYYASDDLVVDYNNVEFKIAKKLIKSLAGTQVSGTFEYWTVVTPFKDIASVIDGRWDTQVQTTFFAEPPSGYNYGIIDLGQESDIQAIDIVAGFFKPDNVLKFDIDMTFTLHYSLDNVNYYLISDKTANICFEISTQYLSSSIILIIPSI